MKDEPISPTVVSADDLTRRLEQLMTNCKTTLHNALLDDNKLLVLDSYARLTTFQLIKDWVDVHKRPASRED